MDKKGSMEGEDNVFCADQGLRPDRLGKGGVGICLLFRSKLLRVESIGKGQARE